MASYQIYNVSDDKPKFVIKKIGQMKRNEGSNDFVQPLADVNICDIGLDVTASGGETLPMEFDVVLTVEANTGLKQMDFYIDYPSDFMEFTSYSGEGWTLAVEQPGYARLSLDSSIRVAAIPSRTAYSKADLAAAGG